VNLAPVAPIGPVALDKKAARALNVRRILMVLLKYAPDVVGCAKCDCELAEDLAARGHQIEVVATPPYYPAWRIGDSFSGARWSREERQGGVFHRTPLSMPPKPSGVRRVAHLASFGAATLPTADARRLRPDLVVAVAPHLAAAGAALAAARVSGAASWLQLQDFEVEVAFDLCLLSDRRARGAALGFEARLVQAFNRVSTVSPAMVARLAAKGVAEDRRLEFSSWVDVDAISVFGSSNPVYRGELNVAPDLLVAFYSGNMAAKQGLDALGELAARLAEARAPVTLMLCADLPRIRCLPLKPLERLGELLPTTDPPSAAEALGGRSRSALRPPGAGHGAAELGAGGGGRGLRPGGGRHGAGRYRGSAEPCSWPRRSSLNWHRARLRARERWAKARILAGSRLVLRRR
jgi:colanic acid biosynthesis glycosyl transferase WcaI